MCLWVWYYALGSSRHPCGYTSEDNDFPSPWIFQYPIIQQGAIEPHEALSHLGLTVDRVSHVSPVLVTTAAVEFMIATFLSCPKDGIS